jgi:LmbE family N-acetylglucosaminyl deacetylase/uncharacterized membrane protein YbhN (UPF0104 family)
LVNAKSWRVALIVLGYAILLGFCGHAIYRILSEGGFHQFATSLSALGPGIVLRAGLMVAATYGLMCIIEQLVLRDVFARMPLGATIAAPLIANSVSIGIGFGAVSGAAIRMRIYGSHGMDTRHCVLVASGVTLVSLAGGACLAAIGLAFEAEGVGKHLGVAPEPLRALGWTALALVAAGLIAAGGKRRRLKLLGRQIKLPSARSGATRLIVGAADWLASASVLFFLLPESAQHNWLAFAAFFAALHFAAMSTGAPAGIGVFDAAMLGLNPTDANSGELAAALVIYRLLSFLAPLALGMIGLVLFESHGSLLKSKREAPAKRISRGAMQRAVHFAGAWFATRALRQQQASLPPRTAPRRVGDILTAALKAPASDLRAITMGKPILVIAPHPDDEVLGCGGLLAACAAAGVRAHVAILTDGSLSHPGSATWSQRRIAARRGAEARRAAQTLGVSRQELSLLGLSDGRLLFDRAQMARASGVLLRLARRTNARTIFVSWRHDPHPDHTAAALIADHVCRQAPHLRVLHYPIWGHLLPHDVPITDGPWRALRLDVTRWLRVKRRALAAYRTQTTTLIADAPITLRLRHEQLDALLTRSEIFLRQG